MPLPPRWWGPGSGPVGLTTAAGCALSRGETRLFPCFQTSPFVTALFSFIHIIRLRGGKAGNCS